MELSRTEQRALWVATALAGLLHLLVPGALLVSARWAYRRVLAVTFRPRPGARRRVRLLGVAFLGLAAALRRVFEQ